MIAPTRADDEALRELAERMRNPARAARRPARPARRQPHRRAARGRAGRAPRRARPRPRGMAQILDYAERRTPGRDRRAARRRRTRPSDVLEGGADGDDEIELRVTRDDRRRRAAASTSRARADQVEGNLNCPLAVTKSAAFFAVRVLTDPDAPPSAGAHRPIEVARARGLRCSTRARRPRSPPATSRPRAGSPTSCSRRSPGATPAPAQGQGTMNNLTLAGDGFTYYETIGGGQGACPDADGPSAIHVAMSNTLNTPVEALEAEYPVRVRELALRRGSGGAGRHRGGDGIVREIEALEPMRFTLITERRRHAPRGRDGGARRRPGAQPAQRRGAAAEVRRRAGARRPPAARDARRRRATAIRPRNFDHKLGI